MHDLHAADQVLKDVLATAAKNKLTKIKKIVLELGTIVEHGAEILPENLKFNVMALARGTIVAGAEVQILLVTGGELKIREIEGD